MSEKLSKDKKVEELAEAFAEVVGDEPEKEPSIDETNLEEAMKAELEKASAEETLIEEEAVGKTPAEEAPADETPADEIPADEIPTDEIPTDEVPTEETPAEGTPTEDAAKPKKKSRIIIAAIVAAVICVVLAGTYFGVSMRYSECFLMGTMVNGTDCSGMTIDEVGAILQKQVEEYVLTVECANDVTEEIKGTDIGIKYNGYNHLKEAFEEQNSYEWPKALFEEKNINAEIVFEYDQEKLNTLITELECVKPENQVAPVSAAVVYKDGEFVIQDEVYGTQIDSTKLNETIHASVAAMDATVSLEEKGCYVQPIFKKDSEAVIAAKNEVNKYLTAKITYSLDGIEVVVDKDEIAPWVSVDANMQPVISAESVKKFTDTLGSKYNTANRGGQITTPTGKVVNVSLAGYGRTVGVDAETKQIVSEIKEGKTVTREPIFSRQATPEGQNLWGTTYIEVDITAQHMWYIVGGEIKLETDIVTGKKGVNDTPTGTYTILEKMRNKTLRGRIVNGKPLYLTPVSYWMRVTWSGIGFHDATWQPTFGGERYVTNGSHGCINMPKDKAAQLYGMISNGTPVIIHY